MPSALSGLMVGREILLLTKHKNHVSQLEILSINLVVSVFKTNKYDKDKDGRCLTTPTISSLRVS